MKLILTGNSQASDTGLKEEEIQTMITTANQDSKNAVQTLGQAMQTILDKLGENWGTQDSIQDVENDIIPGLTKAQQQVAAEFKAVVETVKQTAEKQASDTHNEFSLPAAEDPEIVPLTNKQQSVLDIGLVGVKAGLEQEVANAGSSVKESITSAMNTLKEHLYDAAAKGFVDAGHTVQGKIETHLGNVISAIDTALEELMGSVIEYTAGVVKYEQDIQGEWVQVEAEAVGGSN